MDFPKRVRAWRGRARVATFAGSVLLCGLTAAAQATAPSSMQQPGSTPGAQPQSQTLPGATDPMNQNPDTNASNGQTSAQDRMFVKAALEDGMAEVQLGQMAVQKSNNPEVKRFGQRMIDDHTKLGDQMKAVAGQIGEKVPDAPSKKDRATIAKLQTLNGDDFDRAYMKDMVKDHKADLDDFKTEAASGSNPAVKNAASQGAQVISQHLQMAEQINQKTSAMAANGGMK
jgi:putative membrane protein